MTQPACVVLDTNIVLDVLVFQDPAIQHLRSALQTGQLRWVGTAPMRAELQRVLGYTQIARRLALCGLQPADVLAAHDALVHPVPVAAKAPITCKDPDDQAFIDLAVAQRCLVLSKDRAVLSMQKRLLTHGASTRAAI